MDLKPLVIVVALALGVPFAAEAFSYSSYPQMYPYYIGTQHTFAPYTYVNVNPYTYTNAGTYQYPMQTYPYYPYQQSYNYSYPQYQTGYSQPNYQSNYQSSYYQDYDYGNYNHPAYVQPYLSGNEYCYSGYGCYPFYVEDPHQWVYDQWAGTWY